ncbi:DUF262 domain-containing protein [Pontibacter sp. Tf4]|uniref:DUF262 domain-containing protein n=1 Tax=Pontibacter sp. Tf4 TaxID=2761620 RepID=UPI00162985AE|nr:DUF262 domain-containing protein [Pontibacter sp. Tf4]MBB6610502.1 DUF262 domain-containing protein [Pontibacter sp. Tf4]
MNASILNNNGLDIKSELITLEKITKDNQFFNIPIYQRLYVWGKEQIETLLEDLYQAYLKNDRYYYLGGVMVARNQEGLYDLIDGQQRFTTLWLIGYVLSSDLEPFIYASDGHKKKGRLSFSIRDHANQYFDNPAVISSLSHEAISELKPISDALNTINLFLSDKKISGEIVDGFASFIYSNVKLIFTEIPPTTDENKLFEVMNNRGIQLQQHEILKARLLKEIPDLEKTKYAQLWEACSIMDNYIEKNIKDVAGLKWKDLSFSPDDSEKVVSLPSDILARLKAAGDKEEKLTLLEVLQKGLYAVSKGGDQEEEGYESGKVRSIISFPMLLLHTLRIYLFEKNENQADEDIVGVSEKQLLQLFDKHFALFTNEQGVKDFIKLLWDVRVKFDKHAIKWIEKDGVEIHAIKRLYLNKDSLQRREPEANEGFALLQSMLYHSQQITTHYWLTPFLHRLLQTDDTEELYRYLKQLDNVMFCTPRQDLRTSSWRLIGSSLKGYTFDLKTLGLDDKKGTKYPSYIFYKLDFILWHELNESKGSDWKNFRMTAKNSIEHISPQHPQEYDANTVWSQDDTEEVKKLKQDDFGNLVLLSPSMNSEYSNKTYRSKRNDFLEKNRLESLKSALIFENKTWSFDLMKEHREQMKLYFQ